MTDILAQAQAKGKELFLAGCIVSEFGTRRRRTLLSHDIIMRGLISANHKFATGVEGRGKLAGTSNVGLSSFTPMSSYVLTRFNALNSAP